MSTQTPEPATPEDLRALADELDQADPGKPWQVTAQVSRTIQGWQSSRQVPTFTIPRTLAPTRADAEAKASEIINPFGERMTIHAEVTLDYHVPERQAPERQPEVQAEAEAEAWDPPGPSASYQEWLAEGSENLGVSPGDDPRQDLQAVADYCEAQSGSRAEATAQWPRDGGQLGEHATEAEQSFWQDQVRRDVAPDERQVQDWAEHNAIVDGLGLEPERGE